MKQKSFVYLLIPAGVLLFGIGLFLIKAVPVAQGLLRALPYICIGLGCGAFGHGMGEAVSRRALKNSPELQRRMEIEQGDERNMAIANCAKAKAFDMMLYVFGALLLCFALMGVELVAVLLLVFCYLLVTAYGVYCRCRLEKEM